MSANDVNKQIRLLLTQAAALAVAETERRVKDIMQRHPKVETFCLGMGTASFYDKKGIPIDDDTLYLKSFFNFVDEHDKRLQLTGHQMRIDRTSEGKLVTRYDW